MTTFFQKYVNCMGRGIPLSNDNKISRTSAILPCSAGFYFESRFLFWKLVMKCKSVFTVLGHLFSKWNPMNSIFQWYGSDPKDLCFWWSIFSLSNQFYDNWESVFFLLSCLPLLGKQDLSSQLCSLSIQITVSLKYWGQIGKD